MKNACLSLVAVAALGVFGACNKAEPPDQVNKNVAQARNEAASNVAEANRKGNEKVQTLKSNAQGMFELPETPRGRWALRARHIEKKNGKQNGKEYQEIRHYVTRVVNMPSLRPVGRPEKK